MCRVSAQLAPWRSPAMRCTAHDPVCKTKKGEVCVRRRRERSRGRSRGRKKKEERKEDRKTKKKHIMGEGCNRCHVVWCQFISANIFHNLSLSVHSVYTQCTLSVKMSLYSDCECELHAHLRTLVSTVVSTLAVVQTSHSTHHKLYFPPPLPPF